MEIQIDLIVIIDRDLDALRQALALEKPCPATVLHGNLCHADDAEALYCGRT